MDLTPLISLMTLIVFVSVLRRQPMLMHVHAEPPFIPQVLIMDQSNEVLVFHTVPVTRFVFSLF